MQGYNTETLDYKQTKNNSKKKTEYFFLDTSQQHTEVFAELPFNILIFNNMGADPEIDRKPNPGNIYYDSQSC